MNSGVDWAGVDPEGVFSSFLATQALTQHLLFNPKNIRNIRHT